MKKTMNGSRMEVWSAKYINKEVARTKKDEDVDIIQIESCTNSLYYIVEVIDKKTKNDRGASKTLRGDIEESINEENK